MFLINERLRSTLAVYYIKPFGNLSPIKISVTVMIYLPKHVIEPINQLNINQLHNIFQSKKRVSKLAQKRYQKFTILIDFGYF